MMSSLSEIQVPLNLTHAPPQRLSVQQPLGKLVGDQEPANRYGGKRSLLPG